MKDISKGATKEVLEKVLDEDYPKPILIEDLGMLYSTESKKYKRRYGLYKCGFCGSEFKTRTQNILRDTTKSCGCYQKRRVKELKEIHGLCNTRLYTIWVGIKRRTYNPQFKQYNDYGGRGISMCDSWRDDFMSFYNWSMLNGYSDELSIDRIDNSGNYEPNNCRWTTSIIQNRNQRIGKKNKSGYKGVDFHKRSYKYRAQIYVNNKTNYLGLFSTAEEAGIAYNNYIIENNLEGFILNEIPEVQK